MDRRGNRETEHRCGEAVVDAKCYVGNHALVRTETDIRWDAVEVIGHLLNTAMFSSWNFFFSLKADTVIELRTNFYFRPHDTSDYCNNADSSNMP